MKRHYKAPMWFVKLYNEIINEDEKIDKFLANKVGYSSEWCRQNTNKAFELLKKDDQEIVKNMFARVELIKKYLWLKYSYKNWDKVNDIILSPFGKSEYDEVKKIITISDASKMNKAISNIKEQLKKVL